MREDVRAIMSVRACRVGGQGSAGCGPWRTAPTPGRVPMRAPGEQRDAHIRERAFRTTAGPPKIHDASRHANGWRRWNLRWRSPWRPRSFVSMQSLVGRMLERREMRNDRWPLLAVYVALDGTPAVIELREPSGRPRARHGRAQGGDDGALRPRPRRIRPAHAELDAHLRALPLVAQPMARLSKARSPSPPNPAVSSTSITSTTHSCMCGTPGVRAARSPSLA